MPSRTAFVLAFAGIYLIWGSTYLAMRVAVQTMPPFAMVAARFFIAGTLLFTFLRSRGAPWPTRRQWRDNAIVGTFLLGGNGLVAWAEQSIPSGITALIIGAGPLAMVLIDWAWPGGRRPTPLTFAGLAVGFAGVIWLAAPWETASAGGFYFPGLVAILVGCFTWSFGSIYGRHVRQPAPPFVASAAQMLAGSLSLALIAFVHGDFATLDLPRVAPAAWFAFAYLILAGSLVGFSTYVWLMKHSTPARVSTHAYVNPVVAVLLGWWLLDEPIGPRTLTAATLIITAIALITLQKSRRQPTS